MAVWVHRHRNLDLFIITEVFCSDESLWVKGESLLSFVILSGEKIWFCVWKFILHLRPLTYKALQCYKYVRIWNLWKLSWILQPPPFPSNFSSAVKPRKLKGSVGPCKCYKKCTNNVSGHWFSLHKLFNVQTMGKNDQQIHPMYNSH